MNDEKPKIAAVLNPLITLREHESLLAGRDTKAATINCSLDLGRSIACLVLHDDGWVWQGKKYPFLESCKDRTIYVWAGDTFQPVARFKNSLIKLVPTPWGPPTFEIDGIKMLPTAKVSPYADAERKVGLIQPRGKIILDTCGGLGYFAAWCIQLGAKKVLSYEKNPEVLWLRELNPWSPKADAVLKLTFGDICEQILMLAPNSVDGVLHDPPRFGIAGELYSQLFYDQLARVLKPRGMMFHYTGSPNKLTSGRNVSNEVTKRLERAGFVVNKNGDGLLAQKS